MLQNKTKQKSSPFSPGTYVVMHSFLLPWLYVVMCSLRLAAAHSRHFLISPKLPHISHLSWGLLISKMPASKTQKLKSETYSHLAKENGAKSNMDLSYTVSTRSYLRKKSFFTRFLAQRTEREREKSKP